MNEIYPIVPAGPRPLYLMLPVFVLLAVVLFILVRTTLASQRASVALRNDTLFFQGDLYGKPMPLSEIRASEARIISLADQPSLAPASRRFGTGMPGYLSGWMRLHNGERALVFLTTRNGVVYLPTTRDYSILLSLQDPERFLARIQGPH